MFKKLSYNNNWEVDEYWVDNDFVVNLYDVRINGKVYDVISRKVTVPYQDMGHRYSSTSTHFFVKDELGVEVDLNQVIEVAEIEVLSYKGKPHMEVYPEEYDEEDENV